jgi:hypothetical protein
MKFATTLIFGALASLSFAAPHEARGSGKQCLCKDSAEYLVNGFGTLLSAYSNATADALLAEDFTDTSDSINWLAGCKSQTRRQHESNH